MLLCTAPTLWIFCFIFIIACSIVPHHCNSSDSVLHQEEEEDIPCTTSDGVAAFCRPPGQCPGLSFENEMSNICTLDIGTGFCCPDRTERDTEINISDLYDGANIPEVNEVSIQDINGLLNEMDEEEDEYSFMKQPDIVLGFFEDPPPGDGIFDYDIPSADGLFSPTEIDSDSPNGLHNLFNKPREGTKSLNSDAEMFISITEQVGNNLNESKLLGLRKFDSDTVASIRDHCPWFPEPECSHHIKYRTYDGSCNNLKNPNVGRSMTPYQRLIFPKYEKGFKLPRTMQVDGTPLPSARYVSLHTTKSEEIEDFINTILLMQTGQFIDHDLTHTPFEDIECCTFDGQIPSFNDPHKCFPIELPEEDPFWKGKRRCMSFSRSLKSPNLKCNLESGQQTNQITHWLDGSNIYGSTEEEAEELRDEFGHMKISRQLGTLHGSLPSCKGVNHHIEGCQSCPKHNRDSCYFAGDARVNEQPNLAVLHTLWMREHNRIVNALARMNPGWDAHKLFEQARRINIAEYQHIIYSEWLPIVLGKTAMTNYDLWPLSKGYFTRYNDKNFDPRITNEFSTAAFRFGHSLIPKKFLAVIDPLGRSVSSEHLRTLFFKPERLKVPGMVDGFLRGMTKENMMAWDSNFIDDLRNHLFETEENGGGLDLISLNIQRGRDHGIPEYNAYRKFCGLDAAKDMDDLKNDMFSRDVEKLKQVYKTVDDIDLFVGGIMERPKDGLLGPVFSCIIGDQFSRLKYGDRFFYERKDDETGFTERQLKEIKKTTMARIICDNSDIDKMQLFAFRKQLGEQNKVVDCNSPNILSVNFEAFVDTTRDCVTADTGKACKFPFQYEGKTYRACTTNDSQNKRPWCATETSGPNNTVINSKWGDCGPGCPVEETRCKTVKGDDCVFPFSYKQKRYTTCTEDHTVNGKAWCSIGTDELGNAINNKWGDCSEHCGKPLEGEELPFFAA